MATKVEVSGRETESVVTKIGRGRVDWARPATGQDRTWWMCGKSRSDSVQAEAP